MARKLKIEVYESPLSSKVIAIFSSYEELDKWSKDKDIFADQVSVNGYTLLGWDELYDFD